MISMKPNPIPDAIQPRNDSESFKRRRREYRHRRYYQWSFQELLQLQEQYSLHMVPTQIGEHSQASCQLVIASLIQNYGSVDKAISSFKKKISSNDIETPVTQNQINYIDIIRRDAEITRNTLQIPKFKLEFRLLHQKQYQIVEVEPGDEFVASVQPHPNMSVIDFTYRKVNQHTAPIVTIPYVFWTNQSIRMVKDIQLYQNVSKVKKQINNRTRYKFHKNGELSSILQVQQMEEYTTPSIQSAFNQSSTIVQTKVPLSRSYPIFRQQQQQIANEEAIRNSNDENNDHSAETDAEWERGVGKQILVSQNVTESNRTQCEEHQVDQLDPLIQSSLLSQTQIMDSNTKYIGDVKRINSGRWFEYEFHLLLTAVQEIGENWEKVASQVGTRTSMQCKQQYAYLQSKFGSLYQIQLHFPKLKLTEVSKLQEEIVQEENENDLCLIQKSDRSLLKNNQQQVDQSTIHENRHGVIRIINTGKWSNNEYFLLLSSDLENWEEVADFVGTRTALQCQQHYMQLKLKYKSTPMILMHLYRVKQMLGEGQKEQDEKPHPNQIGYLNIKNQTLYEETANELSQQGQNEQQKSEIVSDLEPNDEVSKMKNLIISQICNMQPWEIGVSGAKALISQIQAYKHLVNCDSEIEIQHIK